MFSSFALGFIELGKEPHVFGMVHVHIPAFSEMAISSFSQFPAETIGSIKEVTPNAGPSNRGSGISNNDQGSARIKQEDVKPSFAAYRSPVLAMVWSSRRIGRLSIPGAMIR